MPLGSNVQANIKELYRDNKRKGKARGAGGKPRSRKQIIAIAFAAARRKKRGKKFHVAIKGGKRVKKK